jgi:hypothetical protein
VPCDIDARDFLGQVALAWESIGMAMSSAVSWLTSLAPTIHPEPEKIMNEIADLQPTEGQLFLRLAEVALMIATRVQSQGEPLRSTVDKVRKRLLYAVKIDVLHPIFNLQLFFVPEVMVWAKQVWPVQFIGTHASYVSKATDTIGLGDACEPNVIPGEIGRCQQALMEALDLTRKLQSDLRHSQNEVARLTPLAERYENIRRKNRISARRLRRVS